MLDLPRVVDAERSANSICSSASWISWYSESVVPRPRQLVLVEDAELHATRAPCRTRARGTLRGSRRGAGCRRARARPRPSRCLHEVLAVRRRATARARRPRACRSLRCPAMLLARLADERAVAHLGERGAQVVDVRRLVGADVAHERRPPRRRPRRGRCRTSTASAHANVWNADTSMNSSPTMRRSIISSERSRSGKRRSASAAARISSGVGGLPPGADDAHALEHRLRHVVGDRVLERDVARREPHLLVAAFVFPARFVARVRFEQAAAAGAAIAVPAIDSSKCDCRSSTCTCADHRAEAFDGADARERRDRRARARPRATGTSTARRSGTPRATARAARRGSRCRTARGATAATPRSRAPVLRAGRDVRAVGGEAAVAAHAARDQRLGDGVGREQLVPRSRSAADCSWRAV